MSKITKEEKEYIKFLESLLQGEQKRHPLFMEKYNKFWESINQQPQLSDDDICDGCELYDVANYDETNPEDCSKLGTPKCPHYKPQLSDDVEKAIQYIFEWADEGMEIYSNKGDLPKHKETIIQHIQALEEYKNHYEIYKRISTEQKEQIKSQASEIDKKDKRIKELKMLLEALEVQLEHCENAMLVEKGKLNAIRDLKNDYDPYLYEKLGIKVISASELEQILKGNKNEN